MIVLSFSAFLALFILIGLMSVRLSKSTNQDYLLAGRNVRPWLAALSAVATNNSGYMFIGQIGYTYMHGLSSIWLMIGWVTGDFLMSFVVHRRLREISGRENLLSFGAVISKWWGNDFKKVQWLTGLITLLFLGVYAAAQFKAGGKALNVLFGWNEFVGTLIGAVMVVAYCFAGGIRASIWTDAAQSFVMFGAMMILFIYAVIAGGGWNAFWDQAMNATPTYLDWFPPDLLLGPVAGSVLFVAGWFFAGVGIVGQPHIMVRMMTLDDPKSINRFRAYYYLWYIGFYLLAIGVGIASRILLPDVANFDPELALPTLSMELLPSILVGVMLAGIFAATMSTADSQILSCSAALTRDLFQKKAASYWVTKAGTLLITFGALMIALFASQNVFNLVLISWSALGGAFAPVLILYCFGQRLGQKTLLTMISAALLTVVVWRLSGLSQHLLEIGPAILVSFLVFILSRIKQPRIKKSAH